MKFHSCSIGGIIYSVDENEVKNKSFEMIKNESLNLTSSCCEFVLILALCHTVIRETETGKYNMYNNKYILFMTFY